MPDQPTRIEHLDARFLHLFSVLKDIYDGYIHYVFTTTASILLIIGWVSTSEDAQKLLARHSIIAIPLVVLLGAFLAIEIWLSIYLFERSRAVAVSIEKLAFPEISPEFYTSHLIKKNGLMTMLFGHFLLYAVLSSILLTISLSPPPPPGAARQATLSSVGPA